MPELTGGDILPSERDIRVEDLYAETTHQIADPVFDGLARDVFDITLPPPDAPDRAEGLGMFAASHLEFRKGAERLRTDYNIPGLESDSPKGKLALQYSARLGAMATTHAALPGYRVAGILGGFGVSSDIRLGFTLDQEARGVSLEHKVLLGSSRGLFADRRELESVAHFAPHAETEFDIQCAAVERRFSGVHYEEETLPALYEAEELPRIRRYEVDGRPISVLRAPKPVELDRAVTGHTIKLLLAYLGDKLGPDSAVLMSTHARFRPYQHLNGRLEIGVPGGAYVETIGFDVAYEQDGNGYIEPAKVLQEVKAFIDALLRLRRTYIKSRAT
jgi:hypothetical protein